MQLKANHSALYIGYEHNEYSAHNLLAIQVLAVTAVLKHMLLVNNVRGT